MNAEASSVGHPHGGPGIGRNVAHPERIPLDHLDLDVLPHLVDNVLHHRDLAHAWIEVELLDESARGECG